MNSLPSSEFIIQAQGLGKCYAMFEHPADRLKQLLFGRFRSYHREFWALRGVDLEIRTGEVVGLVGRNGAGKSTLLQLICGTLEPTEGKLAVRGRIAALLELGSGFNPDFSGRENVYLNATILGLSSREVDARMDEILSFADIGEFVDQPVRTYSSGMFVRLAFAVATSVDPDILVIDEALSVGDGAFARKSFERIMGMKEAGKTILFCSHSIYSVEVLCNRALWIEHGQLRMQGSAAEVTSAYAASLESPMIGEESGRTRLATLTGGGRIIRATACVSGVCGAQVSAVSGLSDLSVTIEFAIDPGLLPPSVAVVFGDSAHRVVASASSHNDGVTLSMDAQGHGRGVVIFPALPLLKGRYSITSYLLCERGLHIYDLADQSIRLEVTQNGVEQGVVTLKHEWLPA
ncbi:ABC transporter ATP-binding protein [Candidatus Accumulibacter vicinus]|uniref:Teichoic acids export ATP-binding protein TagH n=1 Tax=Candidatus Accumulibacter vicinus TaxID=2954382 RepID=A0A084XXD3_9PROT|nr:ABC transporter ATP-binding protein [Candidatus Accumulibacter vicinus]KFB67127.1 MAG: Teichoic acids export ATP-binding protein TagH [Candidatus Accumulibacter vicinus]